MHYHLKMILSDGKILIKADGGINWYTNNILIPMFNNQTILFNYIEGDFVINMASVSRVYFYKTNEPLGRLTETEYLKLFDSKEFEAKNCTNEVLNIARKQISSDKAKSVLEKSFSQIENQVFVIMKFGDIELDSAYEGVIEPCIKEFNFTSVRVDKIPDSGKINDQILENIAKSKFIISDLSGERPNCYYETGFAHALGKEIILTIKESEKIHFDLNGYRFITWKTEAELRKKLKERFEALLKA